MQFRSDCGSRLIVDRKMQVHYVLGVGEDRGDGVLHRLLLCPNSCKRVLQIVQNCQCFCLKRSVE